MKQHSQWFCSHRWDKTHNPILYHPAIPVVRKCAGNEHVISHKQRIKPSITIQKTTSLNSQTPKNCKIRCRDIPMHTVSSILTRIVSCASVPALQGSDSFLQSNSAVSPKLHRIRRAHYLGHKKNAQTALACLSTATDLISLLRIWCSGDHGQAQLTLNQSL